MQKCDSVGHDYHNIQQHFKYRIKAYNSNLNTLYPYFQLALHKIICSLLTGGFSPCSYDWKWITGVTVCLMNKSLFVLMLSSAEGSQLVGALFEGDPASPPAHHDHDEDGSLTSGKNAWLLTYICSSFKTWITPQSYSRGRSCFVLLVFFIFSTWHQPKKKKVPPFNWILYSFLFSQTAAGYTIPVGHQVCVSPTVNHRLHDTWAERMEFNPDRYLNDNPAAGEKFAYVPFGAGKKHQSFCKYRSGGKTEVVWTCKSKPYLCCLTPQAAIAASGRTLPTSRSKPSGPRYCACTTLTWWTDISPQSTTPQWFTPLTTPSSDTRGENHEGLKENTGGGEGQRHEETVKHPECLKWSS